MRATLLIASSLAGLYFFYFAYMGVLFVYLPKILVQCGFSTLDVGILYALFSLMRFLFPFILRGGIKLDSRLFIGSLAGFFLSVAFLFFSIKSFILLVAAYLLMGLFTSAIPPFSDTVALERLGADHYGKVRLFGSLGFVYTVWFLSEDFLRWDFVGIYTLAIAALSAFFGFGVARAHQCKHHKSASSGAFVLLRRYFWLWLSILLFQMSFGGFYNFFTVYGMDAGFSAAQMGYFWIFGVVCEVVMLLVQARVLRCFSLLWLVQVSILASAIRWGIYALAPAEQSWWYFAQGIHALSFALYHTALISYLFALSAQKSLLQQLYMGVGYGIGAILGAILAGIFYGKGLFLLMGFLALLSFGALFLHVRQRR